MATKTFDEVFGQLIAQGWTQDQLFEAVCKQVISGFLALSKSLGFMLLRRADPGAKTLAIV